MNIIVLDAALFYLNSIRSYRRVGNCGADNLRSTIQGCTLGLKLEHRILITILTAVTLRTNYDWSTLFYMCKILPEWSLNVFISTAYWYIKYTLFII